MERYCDSGCRDPTQATACLVIVLVRSIQIKSAVLRRSEENNLVKWKGNFAPTDQNDQTGHSGPCSFKFRSDQTEMVHSIGCTNQNFLNFGLNGKRPLNYWKCVSNFPSPDWHIGDGFLNFSIMELS